MSSRVMLKPESSRVGKMGLRERREALLRLFLTLMFYVDRTDRRNFPFEVYLGHA